MVKMDEIFLIQISIFILWDARSGVKEEKFFAMSCCSMMGVCNVWDINRYEKFGINSDVISEITL